MNSLKDNTDDTCLQEIIRCKTYFLKRKDLRVPFYNKNALPLNGSLARIASDDQHV